ncbi:unnamed protein product [marine sediment metagenome]|uniref:Uncharacterized protein n=1 Tax=marine sediment metagenome TaxID=412755 RepID=X1KVA8_9ZZZZ
MSAQEVLDFIESVMEEEGLRGNQQIETLLIAIEGDEGEDNPHDDDDDGGS